jgi:Xaa-Pro aminopeptidase
MKFRLAKFLVVATVCGLAARPIRADEPAVAVAGSRMSLEQPVSEFKARRQALMTRVREAESLGGLIGGRRDGGGKAADSVIVLVGETDVPEDAKYRQSNAFAYLTGVETPGASLILWPGDDKDVLYLPPRDLTEEQWTGPRVGPGPEAAAATGFDRVESSSTFLGDLFAAIGDTGRRSFSRRPATVTLLDPTPKPTAGGPAAHLARVVHQAAPTARLKDIAPMLAELRKGKSPAEVALVRKAVAITGDAQAAAIRLVAPGVPEYRVEGAILGAFIGGGGQRAGFASIVGSGPNSTILHYNANRRTMRAGDLVVIDIGAEYFYYTADITRTLPVDGKFTPRQREVYRLVLDCQAAVAADFKPGVTSLLSQNQFAREFLRKSPLRSTEDGVARSMDHFFTHGLGHYMGMDVHDVGDTTKPLAPGEIFTIEPGLYLPAEGFGIRIEDDYLVTRSGLEKLSNAIPSDPDEIERLIAESRSKPLSRVLAR